MAIVQNSLLLLFLALPLVEDTTIGPPSDLLLKRPHQHLRTWCELPPEIRKELLITQPPRRKLTGNWQLEWTDNIATTPNGNSKKTTIEFLEVDGAIRGNFVGPVAGSNRAAILSGTMEGDGQTRILTFQQREEGYVCSYQAIDNGGQIFGVWHDTKNRSGHFRLLKFQ